MRPTRLPLLLALFLSACSRGGGFLPGGGAGSSSSEAPVTDVDSSLHALGVATDSTPRVDADGVAYPQEYAPFGNRFVMTEQDDGSYVFGRPSKLLLCGFRLQNENAPLVVLDNLQVPPSGSNLVVPYLLQQRSPDWALEHLAKDAQPETERDATAADVDGDGQDEIVFVHRTDGVVHLDVQNGDDGGAGDVDLVIPAPPGPLPDEQSRLGRDRETPHTHGDREPQVEGLVHRGRVRRHPLLAAGPASLPQAVRDDDLARRDPLEDEGASRVGLHVPGVGLSTAEGTSLVRVGSAQPVHVDPRHGSPFLVAHGPVKAPRRWESHRVVPRAPAGDSDPHDAGRPDEQFVRSRGIEASEDDAAPLHPEHLAPMAPRGSRRAVHEHHREGHGPAGGVHDGDPRGHGHPRDDPQSAGPARHAFEADREQIRLPLRGERDQVVGEVTAAAEVEAALGVRADEIPAVGVLGVVRRRAGLLLGPDRGVDEGPSVRSDDDAGEMLRGRQDDDEVERGWRRARHLYDDRSQGQFRLVVTPCPLDPEPIRTVRVHDDEHTSILDGIDVLAVPDIGLGNGRAGFVPYLEQERVEP